MAPKDKNSKEGDGEKASAKDAEREAPGEEEQEVIHAHRANLR